MWEASVPEQTMELAVGDMVVVGNQVLTVIDIDGDEVSFRLDSPANADELALIEQTGQQPPSQSMTTRHAK